MNKKAMLILAVLVLIFPMTVSADVYWSRIYLITTVQQSHILIVMEDPVLDTNQFPSCALRRDAFVLDGGGAIWELTKMAFAKGALVRVEYAGDRCAGDGPTAMRLKLTGLIVYNR